MTNLQPLKQKRFGAASLIFVVQGVEALNYGRQNDGGSVEVYAYSYIPQTINRLSCPHSTFVETIADR